MKRTSIAQVTRAGYHTLAPHAYTLATYEGFEAHANAVSELRVEAMSHRNVRFPMANRKYAYGGSISRL